MRGYYLDLLVCPGVVFKPAIKLQSFSLQDVTYVTKVLLWVLHTETQDWITDLNPLSSPTNKINVSITIAKFQKTVYNANLLQFHPSSTIMISFYRTTFSGNYISKFVHTLNCFHN